MEDSRQHYVGTLAVSEYPEIETYRTDCAVIGAGVVGLAIARALALGGRSTIVLEAGETIGAGISSRNSEVIHAGIYYKEGSLKARLCVRGKHLLYEYCEKREIRNRKLGKILAAVSVGEIDQLHGYLDRARRNGVSDLEFLSKGTVATLEPNIVCGEALFSPSTGIIDGHELMLSLLADFESAGGLMMTRSPVVSGDYFSSSINLEIGSDERIRLQADVVVNAAGLGAQEIAGRIQGYQPGSVPPLYYAVGHYFTYCGRSPFQHLVYPMPDQGGLGIHVTLDLAGRARFGPDVTWRDTCDFHFDSNRIGVFYSAIRKYFPALPDASLQPGYVGIRPKLSRPGEPDRDFVIQDVDEHGIPGLINLFGIESPGLTASLAIGEYVAAKCA